MSTGVIRVNELDKYLNELYKQLIKSNKNSYLQVDIYIMGGTAVMLNNSFRESTVDIDSYIRTTMNLNSCVAKVANKFNLPEDWLNDNVTVTQSFTLRLLKYCSLYKSYGGILNVHVINNLAQVCMKLVSFRIDSMDISDISGIVENNFMYTYDDVMGAIIHIYGDDDVLSVDAQMFIYNLLEKK